MSLVFSCFTFLSLCLSLSKGAEGEQLKLEIFPNFEILLTLVELLTDQIFRTMLAGRDVCSNTGARNHFELRAPMICNDKMKLSLQLEPFPFCVLNIETFSNCSVGIIVTH